VEVDEATSERAASAASPVITPAAPPAAAAAAAGSSAWGERPAWVSYVEGKTSTAVLQLMDGGKVWLAVYGAQVWGAVVGQASALAAQVRSPARVTPLLTQVLASKEPPHRTT
jgi:hypothetical protein